jgi:putative transposase
MARMARIKIEGESAYYHLYGRVAGVKGECHLSKPLCRKVLLNLVKHYAEAYYCGVAAFSVMGTHYHLVMQFEAPRTLSHGELRDRASVLYPHASCELDDWTQDQWDRLQMRLFDVSEFMRNLHSAFGRWYNKTYERHGHFWADRFKSTLLENQQALMDCMLYVELNAVRAGLVTRPEEWQGSSLFAREAGSDNWLMSLSALFDKSPRRALTEYRSLVYYRGAVPTRPGQAAIPLRIVQEEASRGFAVSGLYRKRLRYFVDGLVVGSEGFVRDQLVQLREQKKYLRRKHPIPQLGSPHLCLREQRSTAVAF